MSTNQTIRLFPIMGNVDLLQWERQAEISSILPRPEIEEQRKTAIGYSRKKGRDLLKATDQAIPTDPYCMALMKRSRALHTHLLYFCGLVRSAVNAGWYAGYGEYKARMAADQIPHFHKDLSRWCKKYLNSTASAVSIGVGRRGYVYLYFIATDADPLKVHDASLKLATYLRKKRWDPIALRPYEKDPMQFLQEKYNDDSVSCLSEILQGNLWGECWQIMRAGFSLPYRHKTLRNTAATVQVHSQMIQRAIEDIPRSESEEEAIACVASSFIDPVEK